MLYILFGLDDFSLHESLEGIKREIGDGSLLDSNTTVLDGQQLTASKLREVCSALPFLAPKRLVIVEGLLGRFESRLRQGRQKKKNKENRQDYNEEFAALVGELPESTVLVLVDGDIKNKNPLLKELLPWARVKTFPLLRNDRLNQWISRRVKQEGGSISPQALDLLSRLVGSNLWIMAGEISKLVSFVSGRRIEEDDVRAVVSSSQQASVFNMVDAVLESKAGQALQTIQQLLKMGMAPPYLLFMLARQARLLVQAKELIKKGKSEFEIQNRLGLTSEFAWRKTAEQASCYSFARLKELYQRLLVADMSIKTGKYEPDLALNILVAELCQQDVN
ncbi:MAG: DNA polymerase III subunit delta [Dehalococcoidia bacterium]|nr:MAG: DNA polymerase III subunit delta [Dehalococcoidia bacterium]